jgi:N-acetylmuramoyl-L-alanine amidase
VIIVKRRLFSLMLKGMNIQNDLLTVNPFSRPGKKLSGVKALVVHWTGNAGSTAKQNRDYFENLKKQDPAGDQRKLRWASAHFIIGLSGEIIQCIPCEEMAYHVGAKTYMPDALAYLGHYPNNRTIGIELCHPSADGRFTAATLDAGAELCALLAARYSLDPEADIWTHYGVTGKHCPRWFVEHPGDFEAFKARARAAFEGLRG